MGSAIGEAHKTVYSRPRFLFLGREKTLRGEHSTRAKLFKPQSLQPRGARGIPGPTRLQTPRSYQGDSRRDPPPPRSREACNLWDRGRHTKGYSPEPDWDRAPRRRLVPAFNSRDPRKALGTFPRGQVRATGPAGPGQAGRSRTPRPPVNQRRHPGQPSPANARSGEEQLRRRSRAIQGSRGLEEGDVIVAGRFQQAPPMGDKQSGLLSVALSQY